MITCCSCGVPLAGRLRPSTIIDILVWWATAKPAIRSRLCDLSDSTVLREWAQMQGADFALDDDGFFCIARDGRGDEVLELDRRATTHEYELGLLLGYPECCVASIAKVGEHFIDRRAAEVSRCHFRPPYHLITPGGYTRGAALISHVPCTPRCTASLRIALAVRAYVIAHPRCSHSDPLWRAGMLA
jgi:hypothetical protein